MGGSHNKKPELPALVSIPEHVLAQELDGECVLLNLETEDYHSLDPVGARAWQLLAESGDTERAIEQLTAEYDADSATVRQDLQTLVADLVTRGLLAVER